MAFLRCPHCANLEEVNTEAGIPSPRTCPSCEEGIRAQRAELERNVMKYKSELERFATGRARDLEGQNKKLTSQLEELKRLRRAAEGVCEELTMKNTGLLQENAYLKEVIGLWKEAHKHETSGACPCTTRRPCEELANLKESAMSESPEYKCKKCETNEPSFAAMRECLDKAHKVLTHFCAECEANGVERCKKLRDLHTEAQNMIEREIGGNSLGATFLAKMKSGLHDFSYLGDGFGVLYLNGTYNVVQLNPEALRERGVELKLFSVDRSPRQAVDKFFSSRKRKEVHAPV